MADPLSLSVSIIAVLQLTSTVVQYLCDVKGAVDERQRVLHEVSSISGMFYILKDLGERGSHDPVNEDWSAIVRSLQVPNGPLDQFKLALERLASKLEPTSGLTRMTKTLTWPFEKKEIMSILGVMERQKSLFSLAMQKDQNSLNIQIKEDLEGLGAGVSRLLVASSYQMSRLQTQEMEAMLNWLCPLDFFIQHKAFLRRRQEGTGRWFLKAPELVKWLDGPSSTLFCPGIPGAGKTMIAATVIDHCSRLAYGTTSGLAYIYCNCRDQAAQTEVNLIACLLKQLVQQRGHAPESLVGLYTGCPSRASVPSLDEIFSILISYISTFSRVFVLVDALDECLDQSGTRRQFIGKLRSVQNSDIVKLMVTSRLIPSIQQEFQDDLKLPIRACEEDVEMFLNAEIRCLSHCVTRDTTLQAAIKSAIIEAIDGM